MPRLNFLDDEPWDEVHDGLQFHTRWFGHPLGADMLGASLQGIAWVATRHPERPVPEGGDKGIIARFELPKDE
jgi:hypothetical protein